MRKLRKSHKKPVEQIQIQISQQQNDSEDYDSSDESVKVVNFEEKSEFDDYLTKKE